MASTVPSLFIVLCVYTFIQTEVHTFSASKDCVGGIIKRVEERHSELSSEFLLSNAQSNESLHRICEYYVPHKVHRVLQLVNKETCNVKIPTANELEETIYNSYVQLLEQLKIYQGIDIPNSFGQFNDRIVGMTKAVFDRTVDQLAGVCLRKNADQIE